MSVSKGKLAYSIPEAAEACGVSTSTIRRAIKADEIPVSYPTAHPVIKEGDLRDWLDRAPTERSTP